MPDALARALLLPGVAASLSPAQQARAVVIMARAAPSTGCTDANCVWLASNQLYRALLQDNATLAAHALDAIYGTMRVWPLSAGGMQADHSFGMHGDLLYSGGYGMEYVNGVMHTLLWTQGTRFALPAGDARLAVFTDFLLDGSAQMIAYAAPGAHSPASPYGAAMWDVSTIGREIGRPYGASNA